MISVTSYLFSAEEGRRRTVRWMLVLGGSISTRAKSAGCKLDRYAQVICPERVVRGQHSGG